jgi:hypothetical protein
MKSLLLPLLLAFGCTQNEADLTIDRFVPALSGNGCVVSPMQVDQPPSGVLDTGLAGLFSLGYTVFPVITNHLSSSATALTNPGVVELHSITLLGANVELQPDSTLAGLVPPAQRKFSVQVPNSRLDPAGSVAVGVEVIPRSLAKSLGGSGSLVALVAPVGDFGGDTIVGAARSFPIEVCSFCLSQGPPAACPATGFPANEVNPGQCIPDQDFPITCCIKANTLLCGTKVPMSMM